MDVWYALCSKPLCAFNARDDYRLLYCAECGADLIKSCANCNSALTHKGVYCTHCGERLKPEPETEPETKQAKKK